MIGKENGSQTHSPWTKFVSLLCDKFHTPNVLRSSASIILHK